MGKPGCPTRVALANTPSRTGNEWGAPRQQERSKERRGEKKKLKGRFVTIRAHAVTRQGTTLVEKVGRELQKRGRVEAQSVSGRWQHIVTKAEPKGEKKELGGESRRTCVGLQGQAGERYEEGGKLR